jgi:hypothetical protein
MTNTSTPTPALSSVPELMHAIHGLYPGCTVSLELRANGYAAVSVTNLPGDLFPAVPLNSGDYPNCNYGVGGYVNVCRYADADFVAALRTALELVRAREVERVAS